MERDFEVLQLLGFNKINCAKFFIRHGIQYDKVIYPNDIKMTNTELIDTIKTILEFSSSLDWYQNILTEEVWNKCTKSDNLEIVKYFISLSKININTNDRR